MAFKGKNIVILLGIAAGAALASFAIAKKGRKIRHMLSTKEEVNNELSPSNKKAIKEIEESESFFI